MHLVGIEIVFVLFESNLFGRTYKLKTHMPFGLAIPMYLAYESTSVYGQRLLRMSVSALFIIKNTENIY